MKVIYFLMYLFAINGFVDCAAAVKIGFSNFNVAPEMQIDEHRLCVILNNRLDKKKLIWLVPGAYIGCEIVNIISPMKQYAEIKYSADELPADIKREKKWKKWKK